MSGFLPYELGSGEEVARSIVQAKVSGNHHEVKGST